MPRVSAFYGVVIYMYWNERDHPVAHFHAYHAGRRASVSADGDVLAGSLDPRLFSSSGNGRCFAAVRSSRTGSAPDGTSRCSASTRWRVAGQHVAPAAAAAGSARPAGVGAAAHHAGSPVSLDGLPPAHTGPGLRHQGRHPAAGDRRAGPARVPTCGLWRAAHRSQPPVCAPGPAAARFRRGTGDGPAQGSAGAQVGNGSGNTCGQCRLKTPSG